MTAARSSSGDPTAELLRPAAGGDADAVAASLRAGAPIESRVDAARLLALPA